MAIDKSFQINDSIQNQEKIPGQNSGQNSGQNLRENSAKDKNLEQFTEFANHLADIASEISRHYFRKENGEFAKEDDSPVTLADREIEAALRDEIIKHYPTHGIIGEEFGSLNKNAEFCWIIDPIDGTSSFIVGRPIFGNLIALRINNSLELGIMNQPITNERWLGINGFGSFLNGKKIQTRSCKSLSEAVLCTSSPFFFKEKNQLLFTEFCKQTKYQHLGGAIYGGDCYSYACLASGFIDIIIEPELKIFDFAAHIPIIENAGGIVSDWLGNKPKLESGAKILACGDKNLHKQAVDFISSLN